LLTYQAICSRPAGSLCLALAFAAVVFAALPGTTVVGLGAAVAATFLGTLCWARANAKIAVGVAIIAALIGVHATQHPVDIQQVTVVTTPSGAR
jgi:hypothetical protein